MGKYNKTKNIASSLEENKNKKIISKKGLRKIFYKIKYISPLSFNNTQNFYFEITKMVKLVETKEPIDLLKLNNEDIKLLDEEIKLLENRNSDCEKFLIINEQMTNLINEWKPMKIKLSNEERLIKDILENSKDRTSLSCRKISNILKEKYNLTICKSKVNLILKNRLKLSYRKTVIKNSKILSKNSIKMAKIFLKIIIRAIMMKYDLIYLDESKIQQVNSNLHCWRGSREHIFKDIKKFQKRNLLLAVSPKGIIYYNVTSENTNSLTFKKFFEGLLKAVGEEKKRIKFLLWIIFPLMFHQQ